MKAINKPFASETTNKITLSESEIEKGIEYKGSIVSNQLNGVVHWITDNLRYMQSSGGYYLHDKEYHKNDICVILHKVEDNIQLKYFLCLSNETIKGITPIENASIDDTNKDYAIYVGGRVNNLYWLHINSSIASGVSKTIINIDTNKRYLIAKYPTISKMDTNIRNLNAKINFIVSTNKGVLNFTLNLNGAAYLFNGVKFINNVWELELPNIYFANVSCSNITKFQENNSDLLDLMPYGMRLELGLNKATNSYGIYARFTTDTQIAMCDIVENTGLEITLDTLDIANYTPYFIIPIRNGGGSEIYSQVGLLREFTQELTLIQRYNYGLLKIGKAFTLENDNLINYAWLIKKRGNAEFKDIEDCLFKVAREDNVGTLETINTNLNANLSGLTMKANGTPPIWYYPNSLDVKQSTILRGIHGLSVVFTGGNDGSVVFENERNHRNLEAINLNKLSFNTKDIYINNDNEKSKIYSEMYNRNYNEQSEQEKSRFDSYYNGSFGIGLNYYLYQTTAGKCNNAPNYYNSYINLIKVNPTFLLNDGAGHNPIPFSTFQYKNPTTTYDFNHSNNLSQAYIETTYSVRDKVTKTQTPAIVLEYEAGDVNTKNFNNLVVSNYIQAF